MCSNILCLPPSVVDYIYFCILLLANTLNCLTALASILLVLRRHVFPRPPPTDATNRSEPVSVVVPCYLPNEQTILERTIQHILTKVEWDGPLTLFVVYNTPVPLPFEERLKQLDGREYAPRRVLRVVHAEGSTSKAENLNLVLQQVQDDYVALYDADHHPDRNSLQLMMEAFSRAPAVSAVQGSTYIRNTRSSLLARAIDAEFFVTHFVYFPAMEVIAASGYFGGSNALWRTKDLRTYSFDRAMLTEDVDLSARALLDGLRVAFCPEARSGELSPAGASALVAQRLRWFMGWEQCTHKYYWKIFVSGLSWRRIVGFCYLFHLRWILLLAAVLAAVINPILFSPIVYPLYTWSLAVQICVYTAVVLYCFVAALAVTYSLHHDGRRRPTAVAAVAIFMVVGWLYVVLHFTLHTVAFLKVFMGREGGWQVTMRSIKGTSPMTPANGSYDAEAMAARDDDVEEEEGGAFFGAFDRMLQRVRVRVPSLKEPLVGRADSNGVS